jgi:cytochrome P450
MSFISFCTQDQNKAGPSFTRTLLENAKEHQLSTDEMSYLAGSLFGAGSDTASHATNLSPQSYSFVVQTAVAITVAIMAAACYPAAQAKVHEELDAVIGSGRGTAKGVQFFF